MKCRNVVISVLYGVALSSMINALYGIRLAISSHLFAFTQWFSWVLFLTTYFIDEVTCEGRDDVDAKSVLYDTIGWVLFAGLGMTVDLPFVTLCLGCMGIIFVTIPLWFRVHCRCLDEQRKICLLRWMMCELCTVNHVELRWIFENIVFMTSELILVVSHNVIRPSAAERVPLFLIAMSAFLLLFIMKISVNKNHSLMKG